MLQGRDDQPVLRGIYERQFDDRWERIALTEQQVTDNDLPVIRKPDNRYRPVRDADGVETEALGQAVIVDALRTRLDALLLQATGETIDDVLERQQQQRDEVRRRLRGLNDEDEPTTK